MAPKPVLFVTIFVVYIVLVPSSSTANRVAEDDIHWLKSIKESLEDPYDHLASWNITNTNVGDICKFVGVSCWNALEDRIFILDLRDMELRGNFPRGLEYCGSLQKLDLSGNKLSGSIPFDVCERLRYVTLIDVSNNDFSGEIPASLADCYYLNRLVLDSNQLRGQIPQQIGRLTRIQYFSAANNQLVGPVPDFVSGMIITSESYANNEALCGGPLKPCKNDHCPSSFMTGFAAGWVVSAGLVFVSLVFVESSRLKVLIFSIYQRRRSQGNTNPMKLRNGGDEISTLERLIHPMNFMELCLATNHFSEDCVMGLGKTGTMYQGTLPSGCPIAIKTIHNIFEQQFINEATILGRLRHRNIIPLLGFCEHGKDKILIYKFMSKGNLHDWLRCEDSSKAMGWPLRVKVAIGLARGLVWLHNHSKFHVVHLNIRSNCILLDKNFEPRISNFGGALLSVSEGEDRRKKTMNLDNLAKKDVYSFGIVLLELIAGLVTDASNSPSRTNLKEYVTHLLQSNHSDNFNGVHVDKSLMNQGFGVDILHFLGVASSCVQALPERRPTMAQVYKGMMAIGKRYGIPYDSEISRLLVLQMKSSDFVKTSKFALTDSPTDSLYPR